MSTPTYLQAPPDHRPFHSSKELDVTEILSSLLPGFTPGSTTRLRIYPVWDRAKMWQIYNYEIAESFDKPEEGSEFEAYLEKLNSLLGTLHTPDGSLQYWVELAPGVKALFYQSTN